MSDEFQSIRNELETMRNDHRREVEDLRTRQQSYIEKNKELEIKLVTLQSDIAYIKKNQDSLNKNLSTFLWLIGGGFVTTFVTWVMKGNLFGG